MKYKMRQSQIKSFTQSLWVFAGGLLQGAGTLIKSGLIKLVL
jgi:hypothetical protein